MRVHEILPALFLKFSRQKEFTASEKQELSYGKGVAHHYTRGIVMHLLLSTNELGEHD